jgi:hypothetical protein
MVDVFEAMLRGALDSLNRGDRKRVTETPRMDNVLDRLDTAIKEYLTSIAGHEHGRCRPCVADQPIHHFTDLLPADFREADAAFDALGGKRHEALLDDIAGMPEVGGEG